MSQKKLINRAMDYWLNTPDANCAQTTACSLLDHFGYNVESKLLRQVYRVYGGGLSWRLVCGTITGNIGALSFLASQYGIDKEKTTEIVKEFLSKMEVQYGDLNCQILFRDTQKCYLR